MTNKFLSAIVASAGCLLLIAGVSSTSDAGQFYQGKTIDIIVGFSAGGGYDQAARLLSRHLGDHIPGHPNVMVENRAGAGGLIAADYVALQAKPDGLTIAETNGGSYALRKVLGDQSIGFDAGKLGWIGTLSPATPVCAIMGFTGFKSFNDILKSKKPIPMGATHAGSAADSELGLGHQIQSHHGLRGHLEDPSGHAGTRAQWGMLDVGVDEDHGEGDVEGQGRRQAHSLCDSKKVE